MKIIVTEWKKIDDDWFKKEKDFWWTVPLRDFEDYLDKSTNKKVQAVFYLENVENK